MDFKGLGVQDFRVSGFFEGSLGVYEFWALGFKLRGLRALKGLGSQGVSCQSCTALHYETSCSD